MERPIDKAVKCIRKSQRIVLVKFIENRANTYWLQDDSFGVRTCIQDRDAVCIYNYAVWLNTYGIAVYTYAWRNKANKIKNVTL